MILITTTFLTQSVHAQTSLIGSINVNDLSVSTSTTFNFDLVSTGETVSAFDYLQITIPDDLDSMFNTASNPICSVELAAVSRCQVVNSKQFQITFGGSMTTTSIKGSVTPFINPKSNRDQENIQIALFNQSGFQRTNTYFGFLTGF